MSAVCGGTSDDLSGQSLGAYEIIGKLGQGGTGAVYKARHVRLDKLMASDGWHQLKRMAPIETPVARLRHDPSLSRSSGDQNQH